MFEKYMIEEATSNESFLSEYSYDARKRDIEHAKLICKQYRVDPRAFSDMLLFRIHCEGWIDYRLLPDEWFRMFIEDDDGKRTAYEIANNLPPKVKRRRYTKKKVQEKIDNLPPWLERMESYLCVYQDTSIAKDIRLEYHRILESDTTTDMDMGAFLESMIIDP